MLLSIAIIAGIALFITQGILLSLWEDACNKQRRKEQRKRPRRKR